MQEHKTPSFNLSYIQTRVKPDAYFVTFHTRDALVKSSLNAVTSCGVSRGRSSAPSPCYTQSDNEIAHNGSDKRSLSRH